MALPDPYGADVIEAKAEPDVTLPDTDDRVDESVADAEIVEEPDADMVAIAGLETLWERQSLTDYVRTLFPADLQTV